MMKNRPHAGAWIVAGLCLFLSFGSAGYPQARATVSNPIQKGIAVTNHAHGTFEVNLKPQVPPDKATDATLGRMSIDKQFHGDLEGTSKGEMLTAMTSVQGSAGYVAVERVTGTLGGRSGTFILQHSATMTRGTPQQSVTVVPDSGTGQLTGMSGKMVIKIADGKHSYDFEYTLAEAPSDPGH